MQSFFLIRFSRIGIPHLFTFHNYSHFYIKIPARLSKAGLIAKMKQGELRKMEKINLTPEEILNKTFDIDLKGYSAQQVDEFIDIMLEDYQNYDANIAELEARIGALNAQIEELKKENIELQGRKKVFDLTNTTSYSSVDLLKRVSRLEEEVFKNR